MVLRLSEAAAIGFKATCADCGGMEKNMMHSEEVTLFLTGEIDHHTAAGWREKMGALCGRVNVVLDLGGVTFMDSSGVGLLLGRYNEAVRCGRKLTVVNVPEDADRLLRLSGVYGIIKKEQTDDE